MQELIKTLFEILTLRKGPDAIPHSGLLLVVSVVLWLMPLLFGMQLIAALDGRAAIMAIAGWLVSLACYTIVIMLAGRAARLLQALTAIIGCGALISVAQVFSLLFLLPFLGENIVAIVVELLLFWSVYVKGHIVARTLEREWYVGLVIAIAVFLLQYSTLTALTGNT